MAGEKQELPVSGESPMTESITKSKKKKKKSKNKQTEETQEIEAPQEVTNGEELSNKEKKKKRKREEKEKKENKIDEIAEKKPKSEDLGLSNGSVGESEQKVVVTGKDVEESKYTALKSFAESKLPENVLDCCKTFQKPSPIQSHTWPFLLDGRDLIGIAKTGSG